MKNVKTIAIVALTLSLTALGAFSVPAFAHEAPHTAHVQTAHHNENNLQDCANTAVDSICTENICINPTENLTADCQPKAGNTYDCPNSVCPNADCGITTTHQHNGDSYTSTGSHHGNRHENGHH